MPSLQQGHYGKAEVRYEIEHAGLILAELQDVGYDFDPQIEAGGEGIGLLKNYYFKQTGAPKGSGSLKRNLLQRSDSGKLFLDIVAGTRTIIQEAIATAAATYTVSYPTAMISIVEIRLNTSLVVLREAVDYTVNYVTGAITFGVATTEAATIRYIATTRKGQQLLINGGFEDALGTSWTLFGTATIARNNVAANVYTEGWALAVTPVASGDGVLYNIPLTLIPGRPYRMTFRAKAAAAETLVVTYYNGASYVAASPASVTLTPSYALYEFTFNATVAAVANIKIADTKASPGLFYIDEVKLIEDLQSLGNNPTYATNPMDAGYTTPITFNVIERRIADGVIMMRLMKCTIDKYAIKSGKAWEEDLSFQFLDALGE